MSGIMGRPVEGFIAMMEFEGKRVAELRGERGRLGDCDGSYVLKEGGGYSVVGVRRGGEANGEMLRCWLGSGSGCG